MKVLLVAALLAVFSTTAQADETKESVENRVKKALGDLSGAFKKGNVDPLLIVGDKVAFNLPKKDVLDLNGEFKSLSLRGLSDVKIEKLDFHMTSRQLKVDLYLPKIDVAVDDLSLNATILGKKLDVRASLRISVVRPGVKGPITLKPGSLLKPAASKIDLDFDLKEIKLDGYLKVLQLDLLPRIRQIVNLLQKFIFTKLKKLVNQIANAIAWVITAQIFNFY